MSAQAIQKEQPLTVIEPQSALTPMDVISRAVAEGRDVEVIEKLMDLQERWEKTQARKAFDEAIAAARLEFKPIAKNRRVGYDAKTPGAARTDYRHEDLAAIALAVDPILGKHGLSYRWRTSSPVNEPVTVTCIVSHRLGHSEENTLSAGRDDSGKKNGIQQIGSTITYLQRYTLKAALGLSASNDDDGRASGDSDDALPLTDAQADKIREMIGASGTNLDAFLKWVKAESVSDIQRGQYNDCIAMFEAKIKQKKAAAS